MDKHNKTEHTKEKSKGASKVVLPFVQAALLEYAYLTPIVCLVSQLLKRLTYIQIPFIPAFFLAAGLSFSQSLSYRHSLFSGVLMGLCYGLAAIGPYARFKQNLPTFRSFL